MKSSFRVIDYESGELVLDKGDDVTPRKFEHAVWAIEALDEVECIADTRGYDVSVWYRKGEVEYVIDYDQMIAQRIQLAGQMMVIFRPEEEAWRHTL